MQKVSIPKDREGKQRPFGFVTFKHAPSVQYAMRLLDGTKLFNRMLTLKERNGNKDQGNSRMEQMQNQPNHFQQAFQQMSSQVLMGQLGLFNLPPSMLMYPSQMNSQANRPYPLMNNQVSKYELSNLYYNKNLILLFAHNRPRTCLTRRTSDEQIGRIPIVAKSQRIDRIEETSIITKTDVTIKNPTTSSREITTLRETKIYRGIPRDAMTITGKAITRITEKDIVRLLNNCLTIATRKIVFLQI